MRKKQALARCAILAATLLWGSSFIVLKDAIDNIPQNFVLAFRFFAAFILLSAVFFKKYRLINKGYIAGGAVIGLLLYLAYLTQTIGLAHTTPGKNAFLTAVYCVIVPFMFFVTDKKRPDKFNIVSALICITGIGLVSLNEKFIMQSGDAFTLVGGFFYAAHMVAVAKISSGRDAVLLTILQFFFAAVLFSLTSLFTETIPVGWYQTSLPQLIYLAVFCTAVALLFQNIGQKYLPPSNAAILLSLESVFGVIFSLMFYPGESLTLRLFCGFVMIFASVIISETKLDFLRKKAE